MEINKKVEYPRLQPRDSAALNPQEYIYERLNESIAWYDKNAAKKKKLYLQMRAITVISGAIVPVLVNMEFTYVKFITTFLSLVVVLFVSLESVYHFREQWINYRSTEQFLRMEYFFFTANDGPYAGKKESEAYRLFVERVESAIESENASTLQVMTTAAETKSKQT
jgi:uncharacterized membrane protein